MARELLRDHELDPTGLSASAECQDTLEAGTQLARTRSSVATSLAIANRSGFVKGYGRRASTSDPSFIVMKHSVKATLCELEEFFDFSLWLTETFGSEPSEFPDMEGKASLWKANGLIVPERQLRGASANH